LYELVNEEEEYSEDPDLKLIKRPFEALGKRAVMLYSGDRTLPNSKRAFEALGKRSSSRQDKLFKQTNLYKKISLLKSMLANENGSY
jgi:hypothetical protein